MRYASRVPCGLEHASGRGLRSLFALSVPACMAVGYQDLQCRTARYVELPRWYGLRRSNTAMYVLLQVDKFILNKYRNCGNLTKIKIGHDNSGAGPGAVVNATCRLYKIHSQYRIMPAQLLLCLPTLHIPACSRQQFSWHCLLPTVPPCDSCEDYQKPAAQVCGLSSSSMAWHAQG